MTDTSDLLDLARTLGIETHYWDVRGQQHDASVEAVLAVLRAMEVPVAHVDDVPAAWAWWREEVAATSIDPVVVTRAGAPLSFRLRRPEAAAVPPRIGAGLVLEDGSTLDLGAVDVPAGVRATFGPHEVREWELAIAADLPLGYHRLVLDVGGELVEAAVLAAPRRVATWDPAERTWGLFAPVYALRDGVRPPDLTSLDRFAEAGAARGARLIGTLPLLATYLDEPFAPSPYSPVSRRFWNELYLDLDALPRAAGDDDPPVAFADAGGPFDYRDRYQQVRRVLEARSRLDPPSRRDVAAVPDLARYARFRALVEKHGADWRSWPARLRGGDVRARDVVREVEVLHAYAQVAAQRQLRGLAESLDRRGQALYLDLPVGAHPDGFDTWDQQDLFAAGVSTGAPPDDFFTGGQDWGFPPMVPASSRAQGHAHLRDCLRHHMQVAQVLRLDHVMGLHRLFWVPHGMSARDGVYVRYPSDELFAVLAIESERSDCVVVGEDLGTVPDEVRTAMREHELLGMYVAEFAMPSWPGAELALPTADVVASVDTHDTPTFAGFLRGVDIAYRVERGNLDVEDAHHEFAAREQLGRNLRGFLGARGLVDDPEDDRALLVGLLRELGRSDARAVLVTLEDLWGEVQPQNVPGTSTERPNWVQRFPATTDALARDPRVVHALYALHQARIAAASVASTSGAGPSGVGGHEP